MTAYPTGLPTPVASISVESPQGTLASKTGIIPAGSNGSIDVYANNPTDLVVDITGYYVSLSFVSLAVSSANDNGDTRIGTQSTNLINRTSFFAGGIRGVTTETTTQFPS